jgi:DHA3 family macrolide efflux protein-like MFS transporter
MPLVTTPAMALLQEQVDGNMQGRVFSLVQILMTTMMPLGMIVFGPIADRTRVETLMILSGAAILALSLFVLRDPQLRRGVIEDSVSPKN